MEQKKLPLVGVIICNYNYSQWIIDAINSAISQDYPNKAIYVVDDKSTDNSVNIIKDLFGEHISVANDCGEYVLSDCFLHNVHTYLLELKQNGGPSRARNFAIKKAVEDGCQIIAILDADDMWRQGKLSKSVLKIMENPQVIGGVYTDYLHLNIETNTLTYESKEPFSRDRLVQDCIVHSGSVINVHALKQVGLYDEDLRVCEDYNLWLRISNFFLFVHIPEDLVIVRVQPQNSSLTVDQERWKRDYYLAKQRALGGQ